MFNREADAFVKLLHHLLNYQGHQRIVACFRWGGSLDGDGDGDRVASLAKITIR
jgi:hypothetical protein